MTIFESNADGELTVILVFLQCLNYIIDSYLMFAASAIAANTIMRSIFGAVFPLFAVSTTSCFSNAFSAHWLT